MSKDGGFRLPLVIDPPTRCVSLDIPDDENHIAAFWGALQELAYWFSWERDEAHTGVQASAVWMNVIDAAHTRFLSGNPCGNEMVDQCVEMAPHHPAIEWQPTNPFLDPHETPSGYLAAPFSIVDLSLPGIDLAYLAGLKNGDVIATLLSIPGNPLELLVDGLPRFLIRVNGTGTVTIHLINLPLGGIAAIGKDTFIDIPGLIGGVIGTGITLVDLNRDLVSIPPETSTIIGQQVEFTTAGAHFIEVAFIPILDDSVTPVRYGGGLRGMTVCGFEPLNGNNVIRQNPDDCNIIEQSADGINWTTVADLTGCLPPGMDGTDGASAELRVSGGYIQWRQDDDSPTWTNLIALSALTGAPGDDGAPGAPGEDGSDGAPGTPGAPGEDGAPGAGGNEYDPPPTAEQPDALCNAAAFIVGKVRSLIYGVIADLATIDPSEILESLLLIGGWKSSALYQLIGLLEAGDTSGLIAEYDAAAADLQCELYAFELDKDVFKTWVNAHTAFSSIMRDAISSALDSAAATGQYALWAAVGATKTDADCDACGDEPPSGTCADFTTGESGWTALFNNPSVFATYHAGQGWGAAPDTITFAVEQKLVATTITSVTATFSSAVGNVRLREHTDYGYALIQGSDTVQTVHTFTSFTPNSHGIGIWLDQSFIGTAKLIEVCYETA